MNRLRIPAQIQGSNVVYCIPAQTGKHLCAFSERQPKRVGTYKDRKLSLEINDAFQKWTMLYTDTKYLSLIHI